MKKINAAEFSKTNDFLKKNTLAEFYKVSSFKQQDDMIMCDVILNGELYVLYIFDNLAQHMFEEQKKIDLDLKKVLFNKTTEKFALVPKGFNGFMHDFNDIIKIEYEKDTGYSVHTIRKENGLMTFKEFMLIDYSLYGNNSSKLYAYLTVHDKFDDGVDLQTDYLNSKKNIRLLLNLNNIKSYGCQKTNTCYIGEVFRNSKETTSRVMYGKICEDRKTHDCEKYEEDNEYSMLEILISKHLKKGKILVKES